MASSFFFCELRAGCQVKCECGDQLRGILNKHVIDSTGQDSTGSDLKRQVYVLTHVEPKEIQTLIKRREVFNGSLTRIQSFMAQFDRAGDMNEINVLYDSLAQIWNKFDGLQTLLKVKEHEADRADLEGTYYKIKSDIERLLASQRTVSTSLAPKL